MIRASIALFAFTVACSSDDGDTRASGGSGGSLGDASVGGSGGWVDASSGGSAGTAGAPLVGPPCVHDGREGACVDVSECTLANHAPVAGLCEGPSEIQCCVALPADGSCDPEAHPLVNAGIVEPPGTDGCPSGMLRVDVFCIDRYEAHLVTHPDGAPVSPYFNPGDPTAFPVAARSAPAAVPQGYITQVEAEVACSNAGKRLCTDDEWLRACEGPTATTYPYGDTLDEGVCNDHRTEHPAIEYFMTSDDWIWSELDHPCLNQLKNGLAACGAYTGCETAEGAFDMMGNLHEWTADPNGTFRGGFYVDTKLNGPGCLYATTAHDVNHFDYSTGFRCCAD
jgi:sulfatase modifying factor 1